MHACAPRTHTHTHTHPPLTLAGPLQVDMPKKEAHLRWLETELAVDADWKFVIGHWGIFSTMGNGACLAIGIVYEERWRMPR